MSDGFSERNVSKKPLLHWPARLWVVVSLIAGGILLVVTIVEILHVIEVAPDTTWWDVLKTFALRCFNILLVISSAGMMLIKRKIGWVLALVSLAFVLIYRSVSWIWKLFSGRIEVETTAQLLFLLIIVILTFGIPIAWLVYFIKARRRFGIGREAKA